MGKIILPKSATSPAAVAGKTVLYADLQGNFKTKEETGEVESTTKVIETTYAQLVDLIKNQNLEKGVDYIIEITNKVFYHGKTLYDENGALWTREIHTASSSEPIALRALSSSEITQTARSLIHPNDIIIYDIRAEKIGGLVSRTLASPGVSAASNYIELDFLPIHGEKLEINLTFDNSSKTLNIILDTLILPLTTSTSINIPLDSAKISGTESSLVTGLVLDTLTNRISVTGIVNWGAGVNILTLQAGKEESTMTGRVLRREDSKQNIRVGGEMANFRYAQCAKYEVDNINSALPTMLASAYVAPIPSGYQFPISSGANTTVNRQNVYLFQPQKIPSNGVVSILENIRNINIDSAEASSIRASEIKSVDIKELKRASIGLNILNDTIIELRASSKLEDIILEKAANVEIASLMINCLIGELRDTKIAAAEKAEALEMKNLLKTKVDRKTLQFKNNRMTADVEELQIKGRKAEGISATAPLRRLDIEGDGIETAIISAEVKDSRLKGLVGATINTLTEKLDQDKVLPISVADLRTAILNQTLKEGIVYEVLFTNKNLLHGRTRAEELEVWSESIQTSGTPRRIRVSAINASTLDLKNARLLDDNNVEYRIEYDIFEDTISSKVSKLYNEVTYPAINEIQLPFQVSHENEPLELDLTFNGGQRLHFRRPPGREMYPALRASNATEKILKLKKEDIIINTTSYTDEQWLTGMYLDRITNKIVVTLSGFNWNTVTAGFIVAQKELDTTDGTIRRMEDRRANIDMPYNYLDNTYRRYNMALSGLNIGIADTNAAPYPTFTAPLNPSAAPVDNLTYTDYKTFNFDYEIRDVKIDTNSDNIVFRQAVKQAKLVADCNAITVLGDWIESDTTAQMREVITIQTGQSHIRTKIENSIIGSIIGSTIAAKQMQDNEIKELINSKLTEEVLEFNRNYITSNYLENTIRSKRYNDNQITAIEYKRVEETDIIESQNIITNFENKSRLSSVELELKATGTGKSLILDSDLEGNIEIKTIDGGLILPSDVNPAANVTTPLEAMLKYNSTSKKLELYNNSIWSELAATDDIGIPPLLTSTKEIQLSSHILEFKDTSASETFLKLDYFKGEPVVYIGTPDATDNVNRSAWMFSHFKEHQEWKTGDTNVSPAQPYSNMTLSQGRWMAEYHNGLEYIGSISLSGSDNEILLNGKKGTSIHFNKMGSNLGYIESNYAVMTYGNQYGSTSAITERALEAKAILTTRTTDASATQLYLDGALSSEKFVIGNGSIGVYSISPFKALVSAMERSTGDTKVWEITGSIKIVNGSVSIVGTVIKTVIAADAGAASWDISFIANDIDKTLDIQATGEAMKIINWSASLQLVASESVL